MFMYTTSKPDLFLTVGKNSSTKRSIQFYHFATTVASKTDEGNPKICNVTQKSIYKVLTPNMSLKCTIQKQ